MTTIEEMRSRLNPRGLTLVDVMAGDAVIQRNWLKVFGAKRGWSAVQCWLALGASGTGSAVLVWAVVRALSR